jgi:phosphoribosylglycinamide formyltransferase-1
MRAVSYLATIGERWRDVIGTLAARPPVGYARPMSAAPPRLPLAVAVLISGRGSNLQALIQATATPGFPARIVRVLSNRADAGGLDLARTAGIPICVLPHGDFADRAAFDTAIDRDLRAAGVDLVCLAGFMRLLTPAFVTAWRDRLINIHPSLLPAYKGLDTHARALADGVKITGCTVHFVRSEMDAGPIIAQAAVPVLEGDDPARLAARVLAAEHRLFPLALRLVAEGRAQVMDDRVIVTGAAAARPATLFSPPEVD